MTAKPQSTRRQLIDAVVLCEVFEASYMEALKDALSDVDLVPQLIDSDFFAIRNASDQERFFATASHLDAFLLATIPETVTFSRERLLLWADEALDFTRINVNLSTFSEIFSSRLQYEPVLQNLVSVDSSGRFLKKYFDSVRIKSVYFSERLPGSLRHGIEHAAHAAIQPALIRVAAYLRSNARGSTLISPKRIERTRKVARSPSFLDKRGAIPFREKNGTFEIHQLSEADNVARYRPLIDRAIGKLVEARTLQRIDNRDRVLARLLAEYNEKAREEVTCVPILWQIGIEIDSRLTRQTALTNDDEKIEEEDLFDLRRLLTAHNLFINCFQEATLLIQDLESTAVIYERIGLAHKVLPFTILSQAANSPSLLEHTTALTVERSVTDNSSPTSSTVKGEVALKLGLLRGLLQAAGGHILNGIEEVLKKSAVDVSSKVLLKALEADISYLAVLTFLHEQATNLITLCHEAPLYFGYISGLLALVGYGKIA